MANDKDFVVNGPVIVGKDTKVTVGSIAAGAIDLATGNYFADTLAANTTYTISNAGAVQAFQLEVTGGAVGYDISGGVYDSVSFSVSAQNSGPQDIAFKSDGTKIYILGKTGDSIYEYNLSTAWDISTSTYSQSFSVSSQDTQPTGIFFKPDGTKVYIVGETSDNAYEYDLSTAWDISTASLNNTLSVSAQNTAPSAIHFKPDGLKMYIAGFVDDEVNEYDLSTAWDISTASFTQVFSLASQDNTIYSFFFKSDGTKMYAVGNQYDKVYEYALTTAWDISTASFTQDFYVGSQETTPTGIFFKPDGTKMYIVGFNTDAIYQYSTSATATLTWPTSIGWAGGVAPAAPANAETDVFTFTTDDTGTSYTGVKSIDNAS